MRLAWICLTPVITLAFAAPHPAHAHAILLESTPAPRAVVPPGPAHVTLRFNSRIDAARSLLELRRAGQRVAVLPLAPSTRPDTLEADTTLPPGPWVLRWQVLAIDGHITRGDVGITVEAK